MALPSSNRSHPSAPRRPGPRRASGMPAGRDEVRRAVLDSAAELFAREGVSEVTLRDVASAANVNLALISRYVGSRDELIEAVLADLTDQLVVEIRADPTGAKGFEVDSVMGRWTRVLTHLVLVDPASAARIGAAPVEELIGIVQRIYDQSEGAARLRVAELLASALGWRLFEPFLLAAAGLADEPVGEVRDELTRTHRRLAATPLPSPSDPPLSA